MSFRLDGRKALVTGASRGIGAAIAVAYAQAGADVAISARDEAKLADVEAERDQAAVKALTARAEAAEQAIQRVRDMPATPPSGGYYMVSMRDVLRALDGGAS